MHKKGRRRDKKTQAYDCIHVRDEACLSRIPSIQSLRAKILLSLQKKIGKACEQSKVYKRIYSIPKDIVLTLELLFLIVIFLVRDEFEVFS